MLPLILLLAFSLPPESDLEPGVTLRVYDVGRGLERLAEPVKDQTANVDRLCPTVEFKDEAFELKDHFIAEVLGYLKVESAGPHQFQLRSDDGSALFIDGRPVVRNDGAHSARTETGVVSLGAGLHTLRILYFEAAGEAELSLAWKRPGAEKFEGVPGANLFTEKGVTRVVSPGVKKTTEEIAGLRPGDGSPLEGVHPGYRVETLHPKSFEPMVGCMTWLPDGRLLVGTFEPKNNGVRLTEPNGTLWALSNLDAGDPERIRVEEFAKGFYHPLGACVVNGALYIAQRDEITRLRDADGDGTFETRETFASGWTSDNYHHFTFGLAHDDAALYASLSASILLDSKTVTAGTLRGLNGPSAPNRGTVMRISLADGSIDYMAGGMRTPNGLLMTSGGRLLAGENQGSWMPASKINWVRPGGFYGHYNETRLRTDLYPNGGTASLFSERPISPPAVWLPQNEISNSPTDFLEIVDGPFAGQVLMSELKLGGIRRVFFEEVGGELQGGIVQWSQGFEGGVNRLLWGPGGSIIVGCIGERDTWSWRGTRSGLQRLTPTGKDAFEIHSVKTTEEGFEVRFTRAADVSGAGDPSRYSAKQWGYVGGPDYGGAKRDEELLTVTGAAPSADGTSVRLTVPGLREGRCVYLHLDVPSSGGEALWATEAWVTVNRLPAGYARAERAAEGPAVLIFSKTAGFRHDSIPEGVACLTKIAAELGVRADATEDAEWFSDERLAKYRAVVFLSTTGDVLNLAQEAAMERFMARGGGYVGVHAASDTEYEWPWYGALVGAYFKGHPAIQEAEIDVLDREHASTRHLPARWKRRDEWYDFRAQPGSGVKLLMNLDESTYKNGGMGEKHPIAWYHEYGGGRAFYTAGGHTKESFVEPEFVRHLKGGMEWALGR